MRLGTTEPASVEEQLRKLTSMVGVLIPLLVVNLIATLYCAAFVHEIISDIHRITGGL